MMKNWRGVADYPSINDTDMQHWAWEFLRRNHEYQKDYAGIAQLIAKYGDDITGWSNHAETPAFSKLFDCSPPALDGEIESQYLKRVLKTDTCKATLKTRYQAVCDKYRVSRWLPDPVMDWNNTLAINFCLTGGGQTVYYCHLPETKMKVRPPKPIDEALVLFDLTRPIKHQLEIAKRQIESWQRRAYGKVINRRLWHRKLQTYLRVLDALEAKAKKTEIVKAIYPTDQNYYPDYPASKKVDKDIAKARQYRDGGYIDLVT